MAVGWQSKASFLFLAHCSFRIMAVAAGNETYGEVEGDMEDEGGEDNIRFITQVVGA